MNRSVTLVAAALAFALLLFAGCVPSPAPVTPQPSPAPAVTSQPVATPPPLVCPTPTAVRQISCTPRGSAAGEGDILWSIDPKLRFVEGELLLTGPIEQVQLLIRELPELELEPIDEPVDLSTLEKYRQEMIKTSTEAPGAALAPGAPWESLDGVIIGRYAIRSGASTTEALQLALRYARVLSLQVYAEPNYVTASPWGVEGSPWGVEGSPWGVEGSGGQPGGIGEAQQRFWTQWAFTGQHGIAEHYVLGPSCERTLQPTGLGVRVGVFDTSPFPAPGPASVPWIDPILPLCIWQPGPLPSPSDASLPSLQDHGLFVAGLVHAIAPNTEIHLVRVLNQAGQGELFTLVKALTWFAEAMLDESGTDHRTVLNLSLGVSNPEEADLPPDVQDLIRQWAAEVAGVPAGSRPLPIVTLETLMSTLHDLNFVIAAAAGNGSYLDPGNPKGPDLPAAYRDYVIGVAASNIEGGRSCYANMGAVSAPGGDGLVPPEGDGTPPPCDGPASACLMYQEKGAPCPYPVISLVMVDRERPTGYGYWVGSSFSTPLVTGSAALLMENAVTSPGDLFNRLSPGSPPPDPQTMGKGVLSLQHTLP